MQNRPIYDLIGFDSLNQNTEEVHAITSSTSGWHQCSLQEGEPKAQQFPWMETWQQEAHGGPGPIMWSDQEEPVRQDLGPAASVLAAWWIPASAVSATHAVQPEKQRSEQRHRQQTRLCESSATDIAELEM